MGLGTRLEAVHSKHFTDFHKWIRQVCSWSIINELVLSSKGVGINSNISAISSNTITNPLTSICIVLHIGLIWYGHFLVATIEYELIVANGMFIVPPLQYHRRWRSQRLSRGLWWETPPPSPALSPEATPWAATLTDGYTTTPSLKLVACWLSISRQNLMLVSTAVRWPTLLDWVAVTLLPLNLEVSIYSLYCLTPTLIKTEDIYSFTDQSFTNLYLIYVPTLLYTTSLIYACDSSSVKVMVLSYHMISETLFLGRNYFVSLVGCYLLLITVCLSFKVIAEGICNINW